MPPLMVQVGKIMIPPKKNARAGESGREREQTRELSNTHYDILHCKDNTHEVLVQVAMVGDNNNKHYLF
jgi:hypothetical protein